MDPDTCPICLGTPRTDHKLWCVRRMVKPRYRCTKCGLEWVYTVVCHPGNTEVIPQEERREA